MRSISTRSIEHRANEVLEKAGFFEVPLPVDLVARRLGLRVEPTDLGDDISGLLVIDNGKGTIGYNASHPRVRQRFSIAHELGHFLLHRNDLQLFIDKRYAIAFRDKRSSSGEYRREREANAFAAALLMPESLMRREIRKHDFDLGDEATLDALAEAFDVSVQAMAYRLANLNLFPKIELL